MSQLQYAFDPNAHAPLADFTVLPKGQYNVAMKGDEWKPCNGGHMLVCSFVVLDGPHAGVECSDNFLLAVAEQKSLDVAQRKLGMVCRAVNYLQALNDTSVLYDKPLTIRTDVRFYEKDGSQRSATDIKKYEPYVGANMAAGPDPVQPTPPASSASAPALGALPSPGAGLRAPGALPVPPMQAPAQVAAPVQTGMPSGFQMPGQNTLGAPGLPGMPMQAPAPAMAAPPAGAPMFRLPGQ